MARRVAGDARCLRHAHSRRRADRRSRRCRRARDRQRAGCRDEPPREPRPRHWAWRSFPCLGRVFAGCALRLRVRARRRTHENRPANTGTVVARMLQAGNSIGGAISQDGRVIAVANYEPGGVKLFDAETLAAARPRFRPSTAHDGRRAKVVGIADAPGDRFVFSLFEAGEIWVADVRDPSGQPCASSGTSARSPTTGSLPRTAAGTSPDSSARTGSRCSTCGISTAACSAFSTATAAATRSCPCTRCRTCAAGPSRAHSRSCQRSASTKCWSWTCATWQQVARIPVRGQPVFVMARPDGRQVWVNFAFPDNDTCR